MLAARPFASVAALHQAAERAWATLGPDDFREAMRAHPRIGEQRAEAQRGLEERRWSSKEQSGMAAATDEQRRAMAEKNRAYEERFGFTYIVCATGKSAAELLATIDARLGNDADLELRRAGEELLAIAKLRLTKGITP
jgi:OHCU decarboxylase